MGPLGHFPATPRGETLPIGRTYAFGDDEATLPKGWSMEWIKPSEGDEVREAGFNPVSAYIADGISTFEPREGAREGAYRYLRNAEGRIVATWDEGRWWTPEESEAFLLLLQVPGAIEVPRRDSFGQGHDTKGGIEWEH